MSSITKPHAKPNGETDGRRSISGLEAADVATKSNGKTEMLPKALYIKPTHVFRYHSHVRAWGVHNTFLCALK